MSFGFRLSSTSRTRAVLATLLLSILFAGAMLPARAQSARTTCFPTCDSTDGRFMALSGTDYNAFAGDEIVIGIGTPSSATHVEIGVFDGDSGGLWDFSTAPLEYSLYADSSGTGQGAVLLQRWLGTSMPDNRWWSARIASSPAAKARNGNHVYFLRIRSTDTSVRSTSAFKLRTSGTIAIKSHQAFAIYAPLTKAADGAIIYPNYPETSPTTYDGTWRLYVDVPTRSSHLVIYDGDMDHGSFDGLVMDEDDKDTPNGTIPAWATATAVKEGKATSTWPIRDPNRPGSEVRMSGDPADDNQNAFYRRSGAVTYELVTPWGQVFANANPSGNLEWEQFRIDTRPYSEHEMDYHVDSVPAGIYQIRVAGMDMGNVNSWKFFNDAAGVTDNEVLGVDETGAPVVPIRAVAVGNGVASGRVVYDSDVDRRLDGSEPGVPSVAVTLARLNPDGTVAHSETVLTDDEGDFRFDGLISGLYTLTIDTATIEDDALPTFDPDGTASRNVAAFTITAKDSVRTLNFGYRRTNPPGIKSLSYWVNNPSEWPIENVTIGGISYTKQQAIALLKKPTSVDKTLALANQLIVAKLNMAIGNSSTCISSVVARADDWVRRYPPGSARKLTYNQHRCGSYDPGYDWRTGQPIHDGLAKFNRGYNCGCMN